MSQVKVACIGLPKLLSDIVREEIEARSDMLFWGAYEEWNYSLLESGPLSGVLLWGVDQNTGLPSLCKKIMRLNPSLSILLIENKLNSGMFWRLKFSAVPITEIYMKNIVDVINREHFSVD